MGGKDSKLSCISYDDAVKRVSAAEFKRLQDAFKRASTLSGFMTQQTFIKEVLGDGVPPKLAEHLYIAFGGTSRGLGFKDLLCGLVLLTNGFQEEKMRFIYGLYANEAGTHVTKVDMVRLIQASEGGYIPEAVANCFMEGEKVAYDDFRQWLHAHRDATAVTRWLLQEQSPVLLTNDSEMPTFYQTLAGVTHLEEIDIIELEKRYWLLKENSKNGKFDLETFAPLVSPPVPASICKGLFDAFDENRDNHVDFKEMACGISACCRGPDAERHKFCFKIFDTDQTSRLSREQLTTMISAMLTVEKECRCEPTSHDPQALADAVLQEYDATKEGFLSREDYLIWTLQKPLPNTFLRLLFQVCHVVLGLKPSSKEEEYEIITEWVAREDTRGLQEGQLWYLIEMSWWKSWKEWLCYIPVYTEQPRPTVLSSPKKSRHFRKYTGFTALSNDTNVVATNFTPVARDDVSVLSTSSFSDHLVANNYNNSRSSSPNLYERESGCLQLSTSSVSLTSTSSSSSTSSGAKNSTPQKPTAIDNTPLIIPNNQKVMMLTNEGGRLRHNPPLTPGKDFVIVPEAVWMALKRWYGGSPALSRAVIKTVSREPKPQLELYPITLRLLRHQVANNNNKQSSPVSWQGMMSGLGEVTMNMSGYVPPTPATPRRYLAYIASFSYQTTIKQVHEFLCMRLRIRNEDLRLWKFMDENCMELLEDEDCTLQEMHIHHDQQVLIEVRNKDLTWPEELSNLAKNRLNKKVSNVPTEKGATGLNNLGNTCFLNSALQCVSNTRPLTLYFTKQLHLYELNRTNPLGMKGHMALIYGQLINELWSGTSKVIAPLKMRWTIGKYKQTFNGFQQHDCQELLAFLLDGLHEDLNRVHEKPYKELKDSDGREDDVVAQEAWDNHVSRNQSVVVDLLHGQLKSQVRCKECGHVSVRFDPFNFLSLPLPMESCIHIEITVMRLDGTVPVRYGLRLNMDEKYSGLKKQLGELAGIHPDQLLLVEIFGAVIKAAPSDNAKVKTIMNGGLLRAYQIPPAENTEKSSTERHVQSFTQIQRMNNANNVLKQSSGNDTISAGDANDTYSVINNVPNGSVTINIRPPSPASVGNGICMQPGGPGEAKLQSTSSNDTDNSLQQTSLTANGHQRHPSNTSTSSSTNSSINDSLGGASRAFANAENCDGFIIAMHRKMIRNDVYFLSSQKSRPSLFGYPLIIPCYEETTQADLYKCVWLQVSRLVSPLPASEHGLTNHAQDCDDSLGYEYPFTLRVVQKDGFVCTWCPWYRFCRGCKIECNAAEFRRGSSHIAIDWDPTALHLRYQSSLEQLYTEHNSIEESRRLQTEPIDLEQCLRAFTKWEELGEDELYYCSKCKQHRLAAKKLDIWRLPPILIVHLKRFQCVNNRWVKSHKIVRFPMHDFSPVGFMADRARALSISRASTIEEELLGNGDIHPDNEKPTTSFQDQYYHWIKSGTKHTVPYYNLYAIVCHTGILGGGHYVCYAQNPNNKWYCYNDSSCKELDPELIDKDSSYILFYERAGLDYARYQPDVRGLTPDNTDMPEDESDYRKNCTLQ